MPILSKQDEVRDYCLHHSLTRPNLTIAKAMVLVLVFGILVTVCAVILYYTFDTMGLSFSTIYIICTLIGILLVAKRLLIGMVMLYQRYASETVRRRCLCKPTCSEYAILVLKKHSVPVGLYKIYVRLFRTCKGMDYVIDYP